MLALLQRDVIKSLGAPGGPADWTQMRSGDIGPQYADVATLAQAARLRDVSGTAEKDINFITLGGKVGTADTKPGLNSRPSCSRRRAARPASSTRAAPTRPAACP
jgi:hypothetical protein